MGFMRRHRGLPKSIRLQFAVYGRYYRPEYTTIVLVGDLKRDDALGGEEVFGDWKRGSYVPNISGRTDQTAPREGTLIWPSDTLPLIYVAFRGPRIRMRRKTRRRWICWRQLLRRELRSLSSWC